MLTLLPIAVSPATFIGGWRDLSSGPGGSAFKFVPYFNGTIPTTNGEASNYIFATINQTAESEVAHLWANKLPMHGIGMLSVG